MQCCSRGGTKAVRWNTSLPPSLAGVKGPSGCAIRQNSKSDPVQQPIAGYCFMDIGAPVLEKVEPLNSDDDDDSDDGDPDFSSDNEYSNVAEQGCSSTNKHKRWPDLDEWRLLA